MTAARWARVAASTEDTLVKAGLTATLDEQHYQGYPVGGVNRSMHIPLAKAGWTVEIHDKWWSKNTDVWIGYDVVLIDPEGIIVKSWPLTKKRSGVVAAVAQAIEAGGQL